MSGKPVIVTTAETITSKCNVSYGSSYECHELLELGPDSYPYDGGEEIAVEDYGNSHAEKTYVRYTNLLIHP